MCSLLLDSDSFHAPSRNINYAVRSGSCVNHVLARGLIGAGRGAGREQVVMAGRGFLGLEAQQLAEILASDRLAVDSEEEVAVA